MRKRLPYIILFILLTIIEVLIGLYVHDSFVRPYLGDILVVIVLYCLIRCFVPQRIGFLPLYIFLFAAMVEVIQLFSLPSRLGIANRFIRILVGSTFDMKDIICYGAGCLIIVLIEKIIKVRCRK